MSAYTKQQLYEIACAANEREDARLSFLTAYNAVNQLICRKPGAIDNTDMATLKAAREILERYADSLRFDFAELLYAVTEINIH